MDGIELKSSWSLISRETELGQPAEARLDSSRLALSRLIINHMPSNYPPNMDWSLVNIPDEEPKVEEESEETNT